MEREEAITKLHWLKAELIKGTNLNEPLDMAIEALSAEHKHCWNCKHYEPKYNVCHAPEVVKQVTSKLKNPCDSLLTEESNGSKEQKSKLEHDREWIIGCIKHDGFIKTDRFDKANQIILEALQAEYEDYEHATLVDIKEPLKVSVVRKPIKGYEDYYEVDQFGRVFAKERTIHVTDHDREYDKHLPSRQMKQSVHTKGYKTVPLTKDGKTTTKFVHRLVAEAFIPNPDDLPFVNHIDEDKTNNFVENLEWCTEQYNSTYGKAREKHAKALKGRHHTEEHKKKISDSLKRFHGERREP